MKDSEEAGKKRRRVKKGHKVGREDEIRKKTEKGRNWKQTSTRKEGGKEGGKKD